MMSHVLLIAFLATDTLLSPVLVLLHTIMPPEWHLGGTSFFVSPVKHSDT